MARPIGKGLLLVLGLLAAPPSSGLEIQIRSTARLDLTPAAKEALIRAAERWENLIATPITVVIDADFGPTAFGVPFTSADHGGTFRVVVPENVWSYADVRAGLLGTFPNSPVFNELPTVSVPTDIGDVDSVCGNEVVGSIYGVPITARGLAIGFNSEFPYDFDPSNGIDVAQYEFDPVAAHAILHALGFTSEVGIDPGPDACLSPLDLFRVPADTTLNTFEEAVRILTPGGEHNLFLGDDKVRLMSTGLPDGTEGDGRAADHWKDDELVRAYTGIMDPTLRPGKHAYITYDDILAMNRLGYAFTKTARPPQQTRIDSSSFIPSSKTPSFKIQGNGFVPGTVAKFKGQNRGTIQNSPTEVQVFLTPQDVATPGLGLVTVFNPTSIDSNPLFLNIPTSPAPCGGGNALCLGGRFKVEVAWETANREGLGNAVALTGDTGYFWFFDPANVEVVVKALTGNNQHYWVFYGALTNQQWSMRILDTQTGEIVTYFNPLGNMGSRADTLALPTPETTPDADSVALGAPTPEHLYAALVAGTPLEPAGAAPACTPGATTLCLNGGRFRVEVDWSVPSQGRTGVGTATPITDDTGRFWFFTSTNIELVVKVLDGRGVNGKFWVFYGALSNVEYTMRITDTQTQTTKTYFNPSGTLASKSDTSAF